MRNRKISIIVPVYNGEKLIKGCLDALINQDYPKDKYEIVVVNDGSVDKTAQIVKKFPVRLINLKKNMGKVKAREIGARAAKFSQLAFIDAGCIADKNWLAAVRKANYQPLVGRVITDPKRSNADRFFYLLRRKIYKQIEKTTYIDNQNFYKMGKGTGNLVCLKELFLNCSPKRKGKYVNDDMELFYNLLKHKKILSHPDPKVYHLERTQARQIFKQWFLIGSTFADFYLVYTKKYLPLLLTTMGIFTAALLIGLLNPLLLLYEALAGVFLLIIISLYFCEKLSDFRFFIPYFVLVTFAASLGVIKRMKKLFFLYFVALILIVILIRKLRVL
ncbi:MAG: glycosyltransferase [Candidatus Marinimicrobia bacterium]|nr:glycosyltransferase [Candidatus Neomarinimicrobiota bacterium]